MVRKNKTKPNTQKAKYAVISTASVAGLLTLWLVLTEGALIKPLFLPPPSEVIASVKGIGFRLFEHIIATFTRVILGYSIGTFTGFTIGLMMSYSKNVYAALNTIVESWRPVPPVALIPFFILWFGFSTTGKIILVAFGSFLIIVVNTVEAARNVRPIYIRAAYSLGADRRTMFKTVIIPSILPQLTSGLRIAMALSVSLVIVSEFMGAQSGLGYLINISKVTFSTQTILLGIIVVGVMSSLCDWGVRKGMNYLTRWAERSEEAVI